MKAAQRVRSKGFSSWLGSQNLSRPLAQADLLVLVARLRAGDDSVKQKIVESHIRLACHVAGRYLWDNGYRTDDIVGAALTGVVQAVDWARERMYDDNITPYIVTTVHRFISEYLEKDHLVRIPRDEFKSMIANHEPLPLVEPISKKDEEDSDQDDYQERIELATYDLNNPFEYQELLGVLGLSDTEREIVRLRGEGHTCNEIGGLIGRSQRRVEQILDGVRQRFIQRIKTVPLRKKHSL